MKTQLFVLSLLITTACAVIFWPARDSGAVTANITPTQVDTVARPRAEVVFVLDTTGSMAGMIEAAKEKIWSIASTMANAQPAPELKIGLVAFRDRGDAYVTRIIGLNPDLDAVYDALMAFEAEGGGDGPEAVNKALFDAVNGISWSQGDAYRAIFLVGDSPAHMDYDEVRYPEIMTTARDRGIVVNTIQCGQYAGTQHQWNEIARLAQGRYFNVAQTGGAIALATPYDEKLAELSAELDKTRLAYGSDEDQRRQAEKSAFADRFHAVASQSARARRAVFNLSPAGRESFTGEKELVADVATGKVDLDAIDEEDLPETLRALPAEARSELVAQNAARRDDLKKEMDALAQKRAAYLADEVGRMEGAGESLDRQLHEVLREQSKAKGFELEEEPEY